MFISFIENDIFQDTEKAYFRVTKNELEARNLTFSEFTENVIKDYVTKKHMKAKLIYSVSKINQDIIYQGYFIFEYAKKQKKTKK